MALLCGHAGRLKTKKWRFPARAVARKLNRAVEGAGDEFLAVRKGTRRDAPRGLRVSHSESAVCGGFWRGRAGRSPALFGGSVSACAGSRAGLPVLPRQRDPRQDQNTRRPGDNPADVYSITLPISFAIRSVRAIRYRYCLRVQLCTAFTAHVHECVVPPSLLTSTGALYCPHCSRPRVRWVRQDRVRILVSGGAPLSSATQLFCQAVFCPVRPRWHCPAGPETAVFGC
jgi:hypothetical protein